MDVLRCAITDGTGGAGVASRCAALAAAQVDLLIVREKALGAGALCGLTRAIVAAAGGMKVLVAGRADVALAAGAAGVHLSGRAGELTPRQVRRVMPGAYVSVSCHTAAEVSSAARGGADLVLFAPVFAKVSAGLPGVGLGALAEAAKAAGAVPVLALGGVEEGNAAACVEAGAAGVAGIRMFFPYDG